MPVLASFFILLIIPSMVGALGLSLLIWIKVLLRRFFDTAFWAKTFFPYLLWPLLMFSGLCYLGRMALLSFWQHGRRPLPIFGGFYQPGQLFDWKHGIYTSDVIYHHLRPLLYDWWTQLHNPVLVDRWLEEQNKSLYFRWGSFFRYFYLGIYCTFGALARGLRRLLATFLGNELGHSVLLFLFFLGRLLWPTVALFLWVFSQCWSRFTAALGGDTVVLAFLRFVRLDRWLRYQWYQRFNVDTDMSPEHIFQRPLPLALLGHLWFAFRRILSGFRLAPPRPWVSLSGPLLSVLGLGLLGLILVPLGFVCGLFFFSLRLLFLIQTFSFAVLRKFVELPCYFPSADGYLHLAWTVYSILLFLSRGSFWAVHFLIVVGRRFLALSPMFVVVVFAAWLSQGTDYSFSIFSFGFGTLFFDFLEQILRLFWIFSEAPSPCDQAMIPPASPDPLVLLDLHEEWMDSYIYYSWGGHRGYPYFTRWAILQMPPKPVLTAAVIVDPHLTQDASFLTWFQQYLLEQAWEARTYQRYAFMFASEWWSLWDDSDTWLEILITQPFSGIYYEIYHRYYGFIYAIFYAHYSYYWWNLASLHEPYLLALQVTPLPYLLLIWPLRFFLQLLRTLAQEWALLYLLLAVLGKILGALGHGLWQLSSLGSAFLAAARFWAFSGLSFVTSFVASLDLSALQRVPLFALLWAYPLRWLCWMLSVIFGDLPSHFSFIFYWETKKWWLYKLLEVAQRCWPSAQTAPWQGFSLYSLSLWLYIQLQFLWDRLCLTAEFPRNLDDYTQYFLYRKPRRAVLYPDAVITISLKGAFFTGHRWRHSPVLFFHYALSDPWLSNLPDFYREVSYWGSQPMQGQLDWSQISAVAPLLADGQRLFAVIAPLLYYFGLLLFCGSCSGASSFLGDRAADQPPFYASRQGSWEQFRRKATQGSLHQIEKFLIFPPLEILRAVDIPMTPLVKARAQKLLTQILEQSLAYRQLPPRSLLQPLAQRESLARAKRSFYRGLRRRLEVPMIFAEFLYSPKYENFRATLLDAEVGPKFLVFLAYFYGKHPEIALCWRNYDNDDYQPWMSDLRVAIVQQLVEAGKSLRTLLDDTNERIFQRQLGEWLWSQDPGNLAFFQTQSESLLGSLAYESEDQDSDSVFPWALCGWFLALPLCLFSSLFLNLEHGWVDDAIMDGAGTGEVYREMALYPNLFGHFYFFYYQNEMVGWDLLPDHEHLNNPISDTRQVPIHGFRGDWEEGYYQAFYSSTIHWCHYSARWTFYWGTWRPQVFFQDEGRPLVRLVFWLLALGWAYGRRSSVVQPALSSWPVLLRKTRWLSLRPLTAWAKSVYFQLFK